MEKDSSLSPAEDTLVERPAIASRAVEAQGGRVHARNRGGGELATEVRVPLGELARHRAERSSDRAS